MSLSVSVVPVMLSFGMSAVAFVILPVVVVVSSYLLPAVSVSFPPHIAASESDSCNSGGFGVAAIHHPEQPVISRPPQLR